MKKILFSVLFFSFISLSFSQPQWKFHVAFEDATAAKDTIWFIWDTTATFYGADTALGEVSANINYSEFNVWTSNIGLTWYDTVKTIAHPYDYSFEHLVEAINFELPITISWDSSLLHAEFLPPVPVGWVNFARLNNFYFYSYGNLDLEQQFDMTVTNYVVAPEPENTDPSVWEDWWHFPMEIYLDQDLTVSISEEIEQENNSISVCPNPFITSTTIEYNLNNPSEITLSILNNHGKQVDLIRKHQQSGKQSITWQPNGLPPGLYYFTLQAGQEVTSGKLIIAD